VPSSNITMETEIPAMLQARQLIQVGRGPEFYDRACELSLEGIVSKRADAAYVPGNRGLWVKVKCLNREEFVVVGWTDPEGARPWLGSNAMSHATYLRVESARCFRLARGPAGPRLADEPEALGRAFNKEAKEVEASTREPSSRRTEFSPGGPGTDGLRSHVLQAPLGTYTGWNALASFVILGTALAVPSFADGGKHWARASDALPPIPPVSRGCRRHTAPRPASCPSPCVPCGPVADRYNSPTGEIQVSALLPPRTGEGIMASFPVYGGGSPRPVPWPRPPQNDGASQEGDSETGSGARNPCGAPRNLAFRGGTESSNLLCSSSQSVSAVNPESEGEKPRTLAAFCGWLGT
jgi:hypothetical protein